MPCSSHRVRATRLLMIAQQPALLTSPGLLPLLTCPPLPGLPANLGLLEAFVPPAMVARMQPSYNPRLCSNVPSAGRASQGPCSITVTTSCLVFKAVP